MSKDFGKIDPKLIATTCSHYHIENVIIDLLAEIKRLSELDNKHMKCVTCKTKE